VEPVLRLFGLTSFGHAAFFGLGAYIVTLALVYWSLTPWLGIPLGMLVGAGAAFLIGTPTFRLRGHYFALSMLAYPLAIMYIMEYLGYQEVRCRCIASMHSCTCNSPTRGSTPCWH